MRLPFGYQLQLTKAFPPAGATLVDSQRGWFPLIREAFTGAWQMNAEMPFCDILSHPTVFACITLIAGDIGKMRWELAQQRDNDIWVPTENPAFSRVIRHPNHYQTPQQFREHWITSKLEYGNTYVLKRRDLRGVVIAEYVLDPCRVKPFVAPDGSVFYELREHDLSTLDEGIFVPAREIIHDRFNCLFHPLVGISPLYAAGIPACLGLKIQRSSTQFFGAAAIPAGILTTPGMITQSKADALQEHWMTNYGPGGTKAGGVAVLGDAMKFEVLTQPADKSQLNEQQLSAAEMIAVAFHVPFYLVGGPMPPYNNIQSLNVQYYTQAIQPLSTAMENCQDEGLGLAPDRIGGVQWGVQFKIKDLLLMDTATQMQTIRDGIGAGVLAPNEGRADLNLLPVEGGDTPYLQQQNFSLAALDRRDAAKPTDAGVIDVTPEPQDTENQIPGDAVAASFTGMLLKSNAEYLYA